MCLRRIQVTAIAPSCAGIWCGLGGSGAVDPRKATVVAGVAQLVEHQPSKLNVTSSSLVARFVVSPCSEPLIRDPVPKCRFPATEPRAAARRLCRARADPKLREDAGKPDATNRHYQTALGITRELTTGCGDWAQVDFPPLSLHRFAPNCALGRTDPPSETPSGEPPARASSVPVARRSSA